MKNVQIIDGAVNCTFPVFQFTDDQFAMIFPGAGQDIAFVEEVNEHLSSDQAVEAFAEVWDRPVRKAEIDGLHGTLFCQFEDRKSCFPASRRECDWSEDALNVAQRAMHAATRLRHDP